MQGYKNHVKELKEQNSKLEEKLSNLANFSWRSKVNELKVEIKAYKEECTRLK